MKLVGEMMVNSDIRTDPVQAAEQEKLAVFNMEIETAQINDMMQQLHGPDHPSGQQQKSGMTAADKKRNRRKK